MSVVLNGVTLKQPSDVVRNAVEVSKDHVTLDGVNKWDIVRQKEVYTLVFSMLTTAQVSDIIAIYNLKTAVTFVFSELSISTNVRVKIQSRSYPMKGTDFRETIVLVLEEV